jgi:hypothetical protein
MIVGILRTALSIIHIHVKRNEDVWLIIYLIFLLIFFDLNFDRVGLFSEDRIFSRNQSLPTFVRDAILGFSGLCLCCGKLDLVAQNLPDTSSRVRVAGLGPGR